MTQRTQRHFTKRHLKSAALLSFSALTGVLSCNVYAADKSKKIHNHKTHTAAVAAHTAPARVPAVLPTKAVAPAHNTTAIEAPAQPEQIEASSAEHVIVTGTLLHDPNLRNASPITRLNTKDMQRRGLKTVTQVLQSISSNGSGNLTNAFSANGAFAKGASAPSMHGLTVDSTLVLMDGQRLSYYPLSDDGERNFVDTNWIPMSLIQTVDVKKDGGSATYGADAVAGVINLITRKEIQGFEGNAEGGLTQRGDNGHQRLYATYGHGSLARDGYNFYVNAEYQNDDALYNRQLGYPYKTGNLTYIGGTNANTNIPAADGTIANFGATPAAMVRPSNGSGGGVGGWNLLNPSACKTQTVRGYAAGTPAGSVSTACTQDTVNDYRQIVPQDRRIEATGHLTVEVGSRAEWTSMFTYSQNLSYSTGSPASVRSQTQAKLADTRSIVLPVSLPNGQLNPNNPYAAQGTPAQIYYNFGDMVPTTTEFSQNFRGSTRLSGWQPSHWGSDWNYDVNFVGMNTKLQQTMTGVPTINGIRQAVTNGTYNFVQPWLNTDAVRQSIAPNNVINALTQMYSGEAVLSKGLFHLPGGMVNLAIGTNVRYESLDDHNANPLNPSDLGAQYTSKVNPFNARGSRWVESGFYEVGIPIVKMLSVDTSGRFDHYSEGFSHFSPKVGVNFRPLRELTLRGTYTNGFRVPSFAETGGSQVGYVPYTVTNKAWLAQHQNPNGTPNSYAQSYSIGLNTAGNPNLKPEISSNFTGGMVLNPTNNVTLSVDYYYIKKSNYIAPNPISYKSVANAYIAGQPLPSSVSVLADIPDVQNPSAPLRPAQINLGYVNTSYVMTDGVEAEFSANIPLRGFLRDVTWYSKGEATWTHRYNMSMPGIGMERFAGTLGPYNTTSGSGTPQWRANWANTFIYKKLTATTTVYYTSGYKTTAEDANGPNTANDCSTSVVPSNSSFVPQNQCSVKSFWDVDLTLNYQLNKRVGLYTNVYNIFGFKSPYDFGTYGGYLYNSSWSQAGTIGRSFQFGINVNL